MRKKIYFYFQKLFQNFLKAQTVSWFSAFKFQMVAFTIKYQFSGFSVFILCEKEATAEMRCNDRITIY